MNAADASARDYTEFFSRHLVGLAWYDGTVNSHGEFTSRPNYRCASGFLLQVLDDYWLVTAGHVVKDARSSQSEGVVGKNHSLLDWFSPRVVFREPIPFDFVDASLPPLYEPEIGVDVAFIPLPSFIVQQLLQTVEPITHASWMHQRGLTFDFYAILGTPAEATLQETRKDVGRESVTTYSRSCVIFLKALDDAAKAEAEIADLATQQFVGRILPLGIADDIAGTSGGLILGFKKSEDGQLRYWPVAIQSRWRRRSGIVFGTSIPIIAGYVHEQLLERGEGTEQLEAAP
jgi:hypothetical protein